MSASPPSAPQGRILVVEDEFLIRLTLTEALGEEGFEVLEAETGDDALRVLSEEPGICLLLTDIQLPGVLNGRTLAARARERLPNLPIIYMTGKPEATDVSNAIDVFIPKPYTLADICAAAHRLTR